jgi:hypothetical protein
MIDRERAQGPREDPARAAHRQKAAARLIVALHRLVKACQLYGDANHAVTSSVPPAVSAVGELCALREAQEACVLIAGELVFVNRRILKGARDAAGALELGALLDRCGVNEVTLERTVTPEAMARFGRLVADAQRDRAAAQRLLEGGLAGIAVRRVQDPEAEVLPEAEISAAARTVRDYAASILFLQRFHAELEAGRAPSLNRVKRIAQRLVGLVERDPQLLISLAASRLPDADVARLAVSTAVIATAAARQLTPDDVALSSLAMAALVADAGSARLGGLPAADRLPESALVELTVLGSLHPASIARGVIAYEALGLEVGRPRGGEPAVLARILGLARRISALRAPAGRAEPPGLDVVVELCRREARDPLDRACLDLLIAGLGFYPLGTLVELSTGEVAMVTGAPALSIDFGRPPVRVLVDPPVDVDLAAPARAGAPARAIRRPLAASPELVGALQALLARGG